MAKFPELKLFKKKEGDPKAAATKNGVPEKTSAEVLAQGMINVRDIIAPPAIEVDFNYVRIGNTFYRTLFVSGYPRFVGANWLGPIIDFDHTLDISMFYYPVKAKGVMEDLRKKITEMEATMMSNREKGKINDPTVSIALDDAKSLQEQLVKGVEKFFQFSFYITIPAESVEELQNVSSKLDSVLGSLLLISKSASLQMEEGFQSTVPLAMDKLMVTRNMDTTSLATTFPFTSSDLTMDDGIMYGLNKHNGSLVIFDRFSMENANMVVFAKSGSGKSYFVKLEALRSMVFGAEIMIIDVESEYKALCEAVGGNYIDFSPSSVHKINPFDLSGIAVEGENELGQKLFSLHTLLKLMLGNMSPIEEAILDRALMETYRIKGITPDPETQRTMEPPVMEDLYKVLLGAEESEARGMAERIEKYVKGSMTGIFDSQSNINFNSRMTVFSTKNLEDILRPIAFYMILDFVWTKIRKDLKKRILIVEEAWYLMQNEDSARFIYGVAKRARKYYLGLTTISQDVDDFLNSQHGRAIVTNSSIQVLLKQHPAAIDKVAETFSLSEGEKRLLLAADRGEGLFFAGANHVAIKVMASDAENKLVTTNPAEILKMKEQGMIQTQTPKVNAYQKFERLDPNKYSTFDSAGKPIAGATPQSSQPSSITSSINPTQRPVVNQTPQPTQPAPQYQAPQPVQPVQPQPQGYQAPKAPVAATPQPQVYPAPLAKEPVVPSAPVPGNPMPSFAARPMNQVRDIPQPAPQQPVQQAPKPMTPMPQAQTIPVASTISTEVAKPMSQTSTIQPSTPRPEPVAPLQPQNLPPRPSNPMLQQAQISRPLEPQMPNVMPSQPMQNPRPVMPSQPAPQTNTGPATQAPMPPRNDSSDLR